MAIETKKRVCFGLVIFFSILAVGSISASLATQYWVVAEPERLGALDPNTQNTLKGEVHFGLFHGQKNLHIKFLKIAANELWIVCSSNHGFCGWSSKGNVEDRQADIENVFSNGTTLTVAYVQSNKTVLEEIENHGMFKWGLWVATIVMAALGIVWGLVSLVFAFINVSTRPVATATGPLGLYIWNTLACFFSLVGVILFVVIYLDDMDDNVLGADDLRNQWTTKGRSQLGYSFYLFVGGPLCYLLNIGFVICSGVRCSSLNRKGSMNDATLDGVMMY